MPLVATRLTKDLVQCSIQWAAALCHNPNPNSFLPRTPSPNPIFTFPPPQLSSGNTNQGFQTQTQGYYPLSFVFGSIQQTAGSNPNFEAGFNPAAMTGNTMSSYSQMSMTRPVPGLTMHPLHPGVPVVTPWAFNQNLGTVLHA
ncbi:hypothetical protein BT96DRAFT_993319 [Gymnopus androsaceus JB14]|uniref:Uncharacterized protein n=1 Tax=Gymnopus androsaceus JB14 TaxID=1447944 RepID=A0A6A4HR08_9AGAR|nr:hypothetical protein BT96DRAFT_993319 [Gymnopus androsaceus JB14]